MNGCQESLMCDDAPAANPIILTGQKRCKQCGKIKNSTDFYIDKTIRDGLRTYCKLCINKKAIQNRNLKRDYYNEKYREWVAENRIILKEKRDKYRIENRGKLLRQAKKWRDANPDKTKIYNKESHAKLSAAPRGRLNNSMRSGMYVSLGGTKAGRKWVDLMGITVEQLKKHLEKQFAPEMTWENYGSYWHIDHKIPITAFNFETPEDIDFKRCWCLKNLQPLEAKENIIKNNKLEKPFQPSLTIKGGV